MPYDLRKGPVEGGTRKLHVHNIGRSSLVQEELMACGFKMDKERKHDTKLTHREDTHSLVLGVLVVVSECEIITTQAS